MASRRYPIPFWIEQVPANTTLNLECRRTGDEVRLKSERSTPYGTLKTRLGLKPWSMNDCRANSDGTRTASHSSYSARDLRSPRLEKYGGAAPQRACSSSSRRF